MKYAGLVATGLFKVNPSATNAREHRNNAQN